MPTASVRNHHLFEESWAGHAEHWVSLLAQLVETNSFSDNLAGVDAVRRLVRTEIEALGLAVEEPLLAPVDSPRPRAAHLVGRTRAAGVRPIVLIAHLDTVFPPDDAFRGFVRDGDVLRGPGVGDIKGGVVAILAALRALADAGMPAPPVVVFLNSDEEVGSHASRDLLRGIAGPARAALGFEPAFHPAGSSVAKPSRVQHVVARKGCGRFHFRLHGVAAHAGGAHHLGCSAIEALARKVVDVHALTDAARGITTNVGLVSGGRSVNTVAPEAGAGVDFRFATADDGEDVSSRLRAIIERVECVNAHLGRGVVSEVEPGGGVLWPPLVPTPASRALSELVCEVSKEWGIEAEAISRGGASDAAHAAAMGTPAICGLGPVTAGIHTADEHSALSALRASTLVAASLLARLADDALGAPS